MTDATTATAGIVRIDDKTDLVPAMLRFTSTLGWNTQGTTDNAQQSTYRLIGNPSLTNVAATDLATATAYYVLNSDGTKYIQSASPVVTPFATVIAFNGNTADALSEININISSGINGLTADKSHIYATNGNIVVNDYEGDVVVYLLNGAQVKSIVATGRHTVIPVKAGTYIVRTADKGTVVIVK